MVLILTQYRCRILTIKNESGLSFTIIFHCHSGLDPESRDVSDYFATGCRIKSGMTEIVLEAL